jgi:hypothetical protein
LPCWTFCWTFSANFVLDPFTIYYGRVTARSQLAALDFLSYLFRCGTGKSRSCRNAGWRWPRSSCTPDQFFALFEARQRPVIIALL